MAKLIFTTAGGGLKQIVLKHYYNQPEKQGGEFTMLDLSTVAPNTLDFGLPRTVPGLDKIIFQPSTDKLDLSQGQGGTLSFKAVQDGIEIVKQFRFSPRQLRL